MKHVRVNGEVYTARTMRIEDVRPGTIVRGIEHRRVYRLLCEDGDELIMRNVRHPDLVEVAKTSYVLENCWVLISEA